MHARRNIRPDAAHHARVLARRSDPPRERFSVRPDSEWWTRNEKTAARLERELQAGVVTINDHVYSFGEPTSPWGGVKASGVGRTHGEIGLRDFTEPKYVARDMSRGGEVWWFPYGPDFKAMMSGALRAFHHALLPVRLWSLAKLSFTRRYLKRGRVLRVLPDIGKLF